MQDEFRQHDYQNVTNRIDELIKENPTNVVDVRNASLKEYHLFYLLDILLPEDYSINITVERAKEKYYCTKATSTETTYFGRQERGRGTLLMCEGHEMLDKIIAERMD